MAVTTTQPEPIGLDHNHKALALNMATSTVSAALGDERNGNGLEPNGHVSPANSQPDSTNPQKALIPADPPVQDQVSNKDAFTLNQSVSAMTPPAAEAVAPTEAPAKDSVPASSDVKDTEMVDAPAESAKPPSPPAEPVPDVPDVPTTAEPAGSREAAQSSSRPTQSPSAVETQENADNTENVAKPEPDPIASQIKSSPKEQKPEEPVSVVETQTTVASDSQPGDLVTPTTSMSKMALEGASQESVAEPVTADTSMTDAPSQASAKVGREREDDEDGEPAAKRARTNGETETAEAAPDSEPAVASEAMAVDEPEEGLVKAPAAAPSSAPASEPVPVANGSPAPLSVNGIARKLTDPALDSNPITPHMNREIRKVLALSKKTKAGANFKLSVQQLWPGLWEQYRSLISRPVDITTIEQRLRDMKYSTLGQFKKDVQLIEENAVTFNGMNHDVSKQAKATVEQIFQRLATFDAVEPPKPVKQEVKQSTRHTELRKPAPVAPKKEARPVVPLPTDKTSDSQADRYALLPSGIPNIRRDSTKTDVDRPKRPIHPPKHRDIGFPAQTARNKKKPDLKFCEQVVKELMSHKNFTSNQWFLEPVDPVALNIPSYFSTVKQPMDLGTMKMKLDNGEYESGKEFKSDFLLIVKNCIKFNGETSIVSVAVRDLEKIFENKWAEKASWIQKHAPPVAPSVAATSPRGLTKDESDNEDASDEEQQSGSGNERREIERALETVTSRIKHESAELDKKLSSANPDMAAIDLQRTIIAHLQNTMVEKRLALAKLGDAKKAPAKASKKKAPGGGGASGTSKRPAGGAPGTVKKVGGSATAAKKSTKKKLTDEEKEIVSEGISRLEDTALDKAISIIKKDTGLKSEDDELELDMDQLSDGALVKLFELVLGRFPEYKDQIKKHEPVAAPVHNSTPKGASKTKKNKPMGKAEQERKLEQLRELKAAYKRPGSGSQEPMPSVENNDGEQQQDSDDSSSEEE